MLGDGREAIGREPPFELRVGDEDPGPLGDRVAVAIELERALPNGLGQRPGPALPDAIVTGTRARYVEAFERITGAGFERYLQEDVIAR